MGSVGVGLLARPSVGRVQEHPNIMPQFQSPRHEPLKGILGDRAYREHLYLSSRKTIRRENWPVFCKVAFHGLLCLKTRSQPGFVSYYHTKDKFSLLGP